ncbi:uncharacterized protein LOC134695053 [Mytilus trossulus]|uniref:uncharacterized protein LOC134695053 n=1 Tax=Mytilus trossulus TaxID=6551 RepID=UPI0030075DA2
MTTETQEIICGPCDFREIAMPAVVWCPTCDEGLCDECSGHHSAAKATRGHKLINSDHYKEMPRKMIEELNKCTKHDERYELFCPNHEIHCCVQCVKEKHANCTGVTLLNKVIENIKSSAMVSTITQKLDKRLDGLMKLKKNRTENIDRLDKQSSELCADFRRMRKEMDLVLDEFENTLNEQATSVRKTQSIIVNNSITQICTHESIYKEMHSGLQTVLAYGSDFQVYSAIKKIEENIMNEDKKTELFLKNNNGLQEINVALECSQQLSALLSKDISLATVRTSNSTLACDLNIFDNLEAQKLSTTNRTAVSELKLKQFFQATSRCWSTNSVPPDFINITSIVPLPSGQTVMTDYGGKLGILLFNSNGGLDIRYDNLGTPHGSCLISDSVIAVSFPLNNNIKLLQVYGLSCTIKNTFKFDQMCFGLCVNSDGNIVAATRKPDDGLLLINLNGEILKRIGLGLPLINYVQCCKNKIIVAELESKEITMYDHEGNKIQTFTFEGEHDTRNICFDKHGNIFVSALQTAKVTVISEKDDHRQDILGITDRFRGPKAIVYDQKNNTIIVANKDGQHSAIYDIVYK